MFSLLCVLMTCFGFYKDFCVYAYLVFMYRVVCTVCMYMHVYVLLDILRIVLFSLQ